ncbi:MAG: glutamate decarboxylase [Actinomycetota bacterium]|nr:glutamate decarboxylase [Actinomycetota bacterium]
MPLHRRDGPQSDEVSFPPLYARRNETRSFPKLRMPDGPMDPDVAEHLIRDELLLDGSARLNLATFVTTWMEPNATRLMADCADKNMIDKDEYPQTAELERRCIHMLAHLWNAPSRDATGCSTTGSSEAAMLAGMGLKWRWRQRRGLSGTDAQRPNLIMGTNVQVCWEKFCRYWDVEPRYVPMEADRLHLGADEAVALCDDNTIGVVAILGSTQDGSYEPVADISAALDRLAASGGPDVPVHVDAASGGFIAPFVDPDLVWDFTLERVASINASGHKYGLVYPGVGWVLWRTRDNLPEDLVFHVNYLGGSMPTFALNFSRPGAQVVAQYYQLIRLGFDGFKAVAQACRGVAHHLAGQVARIGPFELLSDGSELPVFVCRIKPEETGFSVFDVSDGMRKQGWQVPAYTFPDNLTDTAVLRVVVRNGFGRDMADLFAADLRRETKLLSQYGSARPPDSKRQTFHH